MFSFFSLLYPFACHFGVIGPPAVGGAVFASRVGGDKELAAVLTLANGLALPGGKLDIGQVDASGEIIHLGAQLGCFFLSVAHHPVGIADGELLTAYALHKAEIEVQQGQGQGTGRDGSCGHTGPPCGLIDQQMGGAVVLVCMEGHTPPRIPGGILQLCYLCFL